MTFKQMIEEVENELEQRGKYCPDETFKQGGTWNYTDVLKAKLQAIKDCQKMVGKKVNEYLALNSKISGAHKKESQAVEFVLGEINKELMG